MVRILPLYWALSVFMLALLLFVPSVAQTSSFDLMHTIASFLFIPWTHPVQNLYYPMLVPGWSLNYEIFFYIIFAIGMTISRARRGPLVVFTCSVLVAITLLPIIMPLPRPLDFYSRSMVLEFGYGMLLAEAFLRYPSKTSKLWWLAIVIGSVGIVFSAAVMHFVPHAFAVGLPALLIVLGTLYVPLRLDGWWELIVREIGDASYSIYLSHFMAMSALGQVWRKLVPDGPYGWAGFVLCSLIGCTLFGIVVYRFLERPLTGVIRQLVLSMANADLSASKT
ncbi:acyltransferase family protein [Sphingobium psychrophilum]|uniref:acyltransferase family protein n=1 Tax=Sphingobium psychrophilum TaxID=2728834 RepID=UPI001F228CE5|nr:acyltransferase [Sphingobium psychrophilum]